MSNLTAPTEAMFDTSDAIVTILDLDPDRTFTPSELRRRAIVRDASGGNLTVLLDTLRWMVANDYVMAVGNGCWTRYRLRRFNEFNRKP